MCIVHTNCTTVTAYDKVQYSNLPRQKGPPHTANSQSTETRHTIIFLREYIEGDATKKISLDTVGKTLSKPKVTLLLVVM